jgi:hypothetical protein
MVEESKDDLFFQIFGAPPPEDYRRMTNTRSLDERLAARKKRIESLSLTCCGIQFQTKKDLSAHKKTHRIPQSASKPRSR